MGGVWEQQVGNILKVEWLSVDTQILIASPDFQSTSFELNCDVCILMGSVFG